MMRRSMTAGLMGGLLAWGAGGATLAQDEMIGTDLAYYEQVEVPEAGIVLAFPPDWNVDVEMDQRQDFELTDEINEGEPVYFWNVLYASPAGRPWCDLVWWPDHPLSLDAQSLVYEVRMLPDPDSGVERTVDTTPVDLGTGEAYRFDTYNEPTGDYTSAHLFESGSDRYLLTCVGDTFEEVDELEVTQTISFVGDEPAPAVDAQRVEVPEAGISFSFPADWDVDAEMERGEFLRDDPDAPPVEYWTIATATVGESTWCDVTEYGYQPGLLLGTADDLVQSFTEDEEGAVTAELASVRLPVGDAYRVDAYDASSGRYSTVFLFDRGASRYILFCMSDDPGVHDLLGIAQSVEFPEPEPVVEPEPNPPAEPESVAEPELISQDQRVEIPGADIAITFPTGWEIDLMMEKGEFDLPAEHADASPVAKWGLLVAYSPGTTVCLVEMYGDLPLDLSEHGGLIASRLGDGATSVESRPATLPVGGSERLSIDRPEDGLFLESYLFDAGGTRYEFACLDESGRDRSAWRDLAETIELVSGAPEPELPAELTAGGQRVEVPEAGIAVSFPTDWDVEVEMYRSESRFEDPEGEPVEILSILYATTGDGTWCDLVRNGYQAGSLARNAQGLALSAVEGEEDTVTADFSPVGLAVGEAYRVDKEDSSTGETTTRFMFDEGTYRFVMTCMTDEPEAYDLLGIARTLEILGKPPVEIPPEPETDTGRREVPEAELALTLPEGWVLEMKMEASDYWLPDDADDGSSVMSTHVFSVYPGGLAVCGLSTFEPMPMSLERHALETAVRASASEAAMTPVVATMPLPIAEAARADYITFTGRPASAYLFDLDGIRYVFDCWAETADRDAWRAVAETFESLTSEPALPTIPPVAVPEDAVAWEEVRDFASVVPVTDADIEASLVSAWCDRALWIAYADGTFAERFECTLTDEPVNPPEWQAAWPTETMTVTGGECEWLSDFWTRTDGSEVWATSYAVTVDPDGRVLGSASYAADLLECDVE